MNLYLYNNLWICEKCADFHLISQGFTPKGPYCGQQTEDDYYNHCYYRQDCQDRITLSDGEIVGAFLDNDLTDFGVDQVLDQFEYYTRGIGSSVHEEVLDIWADAIMDQLSRQDHIDVWDAFVKMRGKNTRGQTRITHVGSFQKAGSFQRKTTLAGDWESNAKKRRDDQLRQIFG